MLFSVIIPTYNRERIIKRAIDSVLSQTLKDFEVIVVDDGSVDNTEEVVNNIGDPRIVFIKQKNGGAPSARNNGIAHAKGKYVSFLDSDDIWYPEMLESQKAKYDSDPDVSCVYSDLEVITEKGEKKTFWNSTGIEGYIYEKALSQGRLSPTIVLSAKKECFDEVGMFDLSFPASQDDDMCFKLAKKYKFGYISQKLAGVYLSSQDRISQNSKKVSLGWWKLWNKYEKDVVDLCGNEIMAKHYLNCVCRFAICGESVSFSEALEKYRKYGGQLNVLQKILLNNSIVFGGFAKRVNDRLLCHII